MDYYDIGDKINRADLNSLVYLLRKFKKLTTNLTIGSSKIETEYGTLNFTNGFKSIGNNWIIEDDVTVTSDNALKNSFYTFNFTVFDKNLSGTVNYRTVTVTSGSTGDEGILDVEIPTEAFSDEDIILGDYQLEIIFDEHEYYTPLTNYNVTLTVEKDRILLYEDNTIYLTLKRGSTVVPYALVSIILDSEEYFATTDDNGVAEFTYTGKGAGTVTITTPLDDTASISFFDIPDYVTATFEGDVIFGSSGKKWLISEGAVIVDWGDGTTSTVDSPTEPLSHTYTDGETTHDVKLVGHITGLGEGCFGYRAELKAIAIPNTITSLEKACFRECINLTDVNLPESITSIGQDCFYECGSLERITIPDTVTNIGQDCFVRCTSLTAVNIPSSLTVLNKDVFYGCSSLTSVIIPDSVVEIGQSCFNGCSGLTSVTIGDSVELLGQACFRNCSSLSIINIPNTVTELKSDVFYGCSSLTSLIIPNTVTSIGQFCFYDCSDLESIVLSNNITGLGNNTFYGCSSLTSVAIPVNITSIGSGCFSGCTGLTTITIPNKVQSIGENCFYGCSGLTSVSISDSVELIGNNAFNGCTGILNYHLYWIENDIIEWSNAHLINNTNTKYYVPHGDYDNYINKNYPVSKLVERGYRIALSTNKEIIKTSETATITATLLYGGGASSNKTLNYEVKHGNTILDSGTKTTNSNGKATITYNGIGLGEIEITVKYSNESQKTINIKDVLFYDTGVTGTNANYYNYQTAGSKTVTANGTTLNGSNGTIQIFALPDGESASSIGESRVYTIPYKAEFDIVSLNGNFLITQSTSSDQNNRGNAAFSCGAGDHITFWNLGEGILYYQVNNNTPISWSRAASTGSNVGIGLRCSSGNNQLTYKNLVIYPLNEGKLLSIKASKKTLYADESTTISGVLTNDGLPVSSASVKIYNGSTLVDTVTTNGNGEYSKTVTGLSAGTYTFKAVHDTIETNTINITVNNHTYALSAALTNTSIYTDESTTISGVLTKDDKAYASQTVTIKDGNTSLGTVTTNTNGAYTKTISNLSAGSHTLKAEHTNANSSTVSLTVNSHSYSLTASASKSTIYTDESTTISGVLKKDGVVWASQSVKIYDGSTLIDTVKTNSSGVYTKTVTGLSAGNHTLKAQHTNATSSNISITVNTHSYSITASANKTTIYNDESVTITGTLKRDGTVYANQPVTIYQNNSSLGTVTTNSNGVYSKTVSGLSVGAYAFKASPNGTTSSTVNVSVNNHTYNITASTNKSTLYTDESVTISGVLTKDGNVYANQAVTIYDGSTSKGTATTNSSGAYSKSLSNLSTGTHSLKAGYSGISSSTIDVTVNNHSYALTCSLDKVSMDADETVTITGNLKKDSSNWANQTITIYDGNTIIATVSTNSSGNYSKSISGFSTGSHSIRAVHSSVQSANVGLTVNAYSIGISASSTSIYVDGSVTVTGVLTKNGSAWSGQSVTVYDGSTSKGTVTTDSNGGYSMTLSGLTAGTHSLKASHSKVDSGTVNVIVNTHSYSLSCSASATSISYGQSVTLSGVLKRDNVVWASQTITVYDGSTSLGTVTTDGNGNYSKTITGLSAGSHTLKASHSNVQSSNVGVTVNNVYGLTASLSSASIYADGSTVISGVLKKNGAVWSGQTITIYDGSTSLGTVTTNSSGAYSKTLSSLSVGTHTLKASHTNTTSNNVSLTVKNHTYSLSASLNKSSMYTDESVTVAGVLKKDNSVWSGQTITVYDGSTSKGTATTNASGAYSKAVSGLSAGYHTLKAQHSNVTSSNMGVTVKSHSYSLTCTASSGSINYGESVTISGALKKDGANWSGQSVTLKEGNTTLATVTTDSNGAYTKSISGLSSGSHSIKAIHTNATSGTATVTVNDIYALTCSANRTTIDAGDSVTITGNLKKNNANWNGQTVTIYDNGTSLGTATTDSSGNYSKTITGLTAGSHSIQAKQSNVNSSTVTVTVIEQNSVLIEMLGNTFTFCPSSNYDNAWIGTTGQATIKWGDGNTNTINNPTAELKHSYSSLALYTIRIEGTITKIGNKFIQGNTTARAVTIPKTVTSFGSNCFRGCTGIYTYNLFWKGNEILNYLGSEAMPITAGGKFIIPAGETSNYVDKGYPSAKLEERS